MPVRPGEPAHTGRGERPARPGPSQPTPGDRLWLSSHQAQPQEDTGGWRSTPEIHQVRKGGSHGDSHRRLSHGPPAPPPSPAPSPHGTGEGAPCRGPRLPGVPRRRPGRGTRLALQGQPPRSTGRRALRPCPVHAAPAPRAEPRPLPGLPPPPGPSPRGFRSSSSDSDSPSSATAMGTAFRGWEGSGGSCIPE